MSGFFMFKKMYSQNPKKKKLINKGYKILLDLLYNKNPKLKLLM